MNTSEEYDGGDDPFELEAVRSVWTAFMYITVHKIKMSEDQASSVVDTGIDIMTHLKSVDGDIAINIYQAVFLTLHNLVINENVNKEFFKNQNILSKCLDVFKKNDNITWDCKTIDLMACVTRFFIRCRQQGFFDQASDYEQLLPFIIVCVKKFPSDISIQKHTIDLLNDSCNVLNDKKIFERSGTMVVLGELLASNDVNERVKKKVRTLIHRITAP